MTVATTTTESAVDTRYLEHASHSRLATSFELLLQGHVANEEDDVMPVSPADLVLVYGHPVYAGSSLRWKDVDVLF